MSQEQIEAVEMTHYTCQKCGQNTADNNHECKQCYMIEGTQIDGEHEYHVRSFVERGEEPSNEEAQCILIQDHAFGCIEEDDIDLYDQETLERFQYGDGMTCIKLYGITQITRQQMTVLENLRIA